MHKYEEIEPNERGWLWSNELKLYLGIVDQQIRFFDSNGTLVLTPEAGKAQAVAKAKVAQAQAEAAIANV